MGQVVPPTWRDVREHLRKLAFGINELMDGKHNATGSLTLDANQGSTAFTDRRVGVSSVITFMPKTTTAATAAQTMYVSARGDGTFTITHVNNAAANKDFDYTISG